MENARAHGDPTKSQREAGLGLGLRVLKVLYSASGKIADGYYLIFPIKWTSIPKVVQTVTDYN